MFKLENQHYGKLTHELEIYKTLSGDLDVSVTDNFAGQGHASMNMNRDQVRLLRDWLDGWLRHGDNWD